MRFDSPAKTRYQEQLNERTDFKHMIADEPPADVAPVVHGRWIQINGIAPPEHHGKHKCSECGGMALEKHMREVLSNYCPNCGAKMDGGDGR